jgi:MULE transposase domain
MEEPSVQAVEMFLGKDWAQLLVLSGQRFRFHGVMWTTPANLLSVQLYPEVLILDTTKGKNIYNLPLAYMVGMNGENQTENWVTGLLPTEKEVDFHWLIRTLQFFLRPTLQALNVVISDGCKELCNALDYAIKMGIFNRSTRRLLCYFHTIIQHMDAHIKYVGPDVLKVFFFFWVLQIGFCFYFGGVG